MNKQNEKSSARPAAANLIAETGHFPIVMESKSTMKRKAAKVPRKKPPVGGSPAIWGRDDVVEIYPLIQAYIIGRLGWQLGEDVAQKAIYEIIENLSQIRGTTKEAFRAFCFGVARHKYYDALRSEYRDDERIQPLDPAEFVKVTEAGAEGAKLSPGTSSDLHYILSILRASKFPCDEVLWEYFIIGLEPEELALVYNISPDAARMKLRRCWNAAKLIAKRHG